MESTYDSFEEKLLSGDNQWKQPYKYIVLKNLLENYPAPQKKGNIVDSSEQLTKAKELNIQSFWVDLLNEGYCEDIEFNDKLEIRIEDLSDHQKKHLLKICDGRIENKSIKDIVLSDACVEQIKELSGLKEYEFASSRIAIKHCTQILKGLENDDHDKKQKIVEQLRKTRKQQELEKMEAIMANEKTIEEYQKIKPTEVASQENIDEINASSNKIPIPTEYRTLNITNNFNRVKRNQGLQNEDFKNLIFEGIKDRDREGLRNQNVLISALIFDISENGNIRLFGTGKLDADTVIQNRKNRGKKDQISIKVVDFSSFSNNSDEVMPILPELKNNSLKKYFSSIVNHVDSVEVFQELIDEVENNPSKDIESKSIVGKTDRVENDVQQISQIQIRKFIDSLNLINPRPYTSVLRTFMEFSNKCKSREFEQILTQFFRGKIENSINN